MALSAETWWDVVGQFFKLSHCGLSLYKGFSVSDAFAGLGPEYFDQTLARATAFVASCDTVLQILLANS
jgi:hypothetical protein